MWFTAVGEMGSAAGSSALLLARVLDSQTFLDELLVPSFPVGLAEANARRSDPDRDAEVARGLGEVQAPVRVRLAVLRPVEFVSVQRRDRRVDHCRAFDDERVVAVPVGLEMERHERRVSNIAE